VIDLKQTKPLGRTGLALPVFGLGTAPLGQYGEAEAVATVARAFERGVRFFDTAPFYTPRYPGTAERAIGKALAGVPRDQYVLSTKVGRLVRDGTTVFDFSRDGVLTSLDESLARLGLDRVDILHVHDPDDHYREALDGAFPAIIDLRAQGVIRALGAGMNQWQMLQAFSAHTDLDCCLLAGRYTLLEQPALAFLEHCRRRHIGVVLGGVYNSGVLASDLTPGTTYDYLPVTEAVLERARRLGALCQGYGVSLKSVAAQFPFAHPAVTSVVLGAEDVRQCEDNLDALAAQVPAALWHALLEQGLVEAATVLPGRPAG
jgi:D-threo-aldose 1-dehydrogenase